MRKHYEKQARFDRTPVSELVLNVDCRDEIIPILAGLQYVYTCSELRRKVVNLVAKDINRESRRDVGRRGLDDWQIVVLAAVRLGCNYDYDKLQDQAENHRALRIILGVGEWTEGTSFRSRRIRDTLCQLSPETLAAISHAIVMHGQELHGTASQTVRADSFVVETNIHFPSESTLIYDGMRKIVPLAKELADLVGATGWRQSACLLRRIREQLREIGRIVTSKSAKTKKKLEPAYQSLLRKAKIIINRAKALQIKATEEKAQAKVQSLATSMRYWIKLTNQVCSIAYRRVVLKEKVPNNEKLFSLFEPHTQLYRRGKAQSLNQFGRQLLVFEDGAGFISHYHLMDRELSDPDVIVDQTRKAQNKHGGMIRMGSFDRGFYNKENAEKLKKILDEPCLPPRHTNEYSKWLKEVSVAFRKARQRHSGVESAIGALQSGNGLKRCRDHSELGFERYLGFAILGRNIHVLGKLLIAKTNHTAQAAETKRSAA